jgi:hypothetical protein
MHQILARICSHGHLRKAAGALRVGIFVAAAFWCAAPAVCPAAGPNENAAQTGAPHRGRIFSHGFVIENDQIRAMTIAAIDPETGAWSRLPVNSAIFDVSPDRQTIVFTSENALWNSDTSEKPNPGKIFSQDGGPVFSPDGRSLLVTTWKRNAGDERKRDSTVWSMAIDGTNATSLAELGGGRVTGCSPDGKWWAVMGSQYNVELHRADGTERRQLVKSGMHPAFSPDGRKLVYVRQWEGAIRTVDIDSTNDKLLFQAPHLTHVLLARFSPDGKSVAAILNDMQLGDDGEPQLTPDPKIAHPRIGVINVDTGDLHDLHLRPQDGLEFAPANRLVWR